MQIPDVVIQNTVLELFAQTCLAKDDVMWLSTLERAWGQTQLRRADLLRGIASLCTGGFFDLEEQDNETHLSLTSEGRRLKSEVVREDGGYWLGRLRSEILPHVRAHKLAERAQGGGRRSYEHDSSVVIPWPHY